MDEQVLLWLAVQYYLCSSWLNPNLKRPGKYIWVARNRDPPVRFVRSRKPIGSIAAIDEAINVMCVPKEDALVTSLAAGECIPLWNNPRDSQIVGVLHRKR